MGTEDRSSELGDKEDKISAYKQMGTEDWSSE
jgi:hypothetical protein